MYVHETTSYITSLSTLFFFLHSSRLHIPHWIFNWMHAFAYVMVALEIPIAAILAIFFSLIERFLYAFSGWIFLIFCSTLEYIAIHNDIHTVCMSMSVWPITASPKHGKIEHNIVSNVLWWDPELFFIPTFFLRRFLLLVASFCFEHFLTRHVFSTFFSLSICFYSILARGLFCCWFFFLSPSAVYSSLS